MLLFGRQSKSLVLGKTSMKFNLRSSFITNIIPYFFCDFHFCDFRRAVCHSRSMVFNCNLEKKRHMTSKMLLLFFQMQQYLYNKSLPLLPPSYMHHHVDLNCACIILHSRNFVGVWDREELEASNENLKNADIARNCEDYVVSLELPINFTFVNQSFLFIFQYYYFILCAYNNWKVKKEMRSAEGF